MQIRVEEPEDTGREALLTQAELGRNQNRPRENMERATPTPPRRKPEKNPLNLKV